MQDRRIRKTKTAIQTALSSLLSQKDIKSITVKELCLLADINKSTFYLHYKDIYHCADCFVDEVIEKINQITCSYNLTELVDNLPLILKSIMKIFHQSKDLYIPFLKSPYLVSSLARIKSSMIENILKNASDNEKKDAMHPLSVTFVVYGIMGILQHHNFDNISEDTAYLLANKIQNGFKCSL